MTKEVKMQGHILVPKHVLLTKEEVTQLFVKYNISAKQMPQISVKDPAIQDLNAEPGDVIKITRESETESQAIFFRIIIP